MLFLVFFISTIVVKCYLHRIVITLHHANLLSKRSKSQCHPSPICGKSHFHLVICSFRVSSCDKKNLKWIFILYDVLWTHFVFWYKTHKSFHNTCTSCGMKIHLRSYIYAVCLYFFQTLTYMYMYVLCSTKGLDITEYPPTRGSRTLHFFPGFPAKSHVA